jgi:epoxyqueuosine reductase
MGFSLNKAVKPQTIELNKKARIFSNEFSPIKRLYVEDEKKRFSKKDLIVLLKSIRKIYKVPFSMMKTVKLIKNDRPGTTNQLSYEIFADLVKLLNSLGVDDYGFFEITPERLFKGCGVPHKYALVFSSEMNIEAFKEAPSMECQIEVAKIYSRTGDIANKVASYLQSKGFGASPNHSMGGQLDYSMAAEWAGIGITGRHSMAMTKKNGPCHRISVVYTDIENLSDYITRKNNDMLWINNFCKRCGKCIRKCPTKAILQKPVILDGINPTKIDYNKCCQGFLNYGCGICIKECPFTNIGYEKLKHTFQKQNLK